MSLRANDFREAGKADARVLFEHAKAKLDAGGLSPAGVDLVSAVLQDAIDRQIEHFRSGGVPPTLISAWRKAHHREMQKLLAQRSRELHRAEEGTPPSLDVH